MQTDKQLLRATLTFRKVVDGALAVAHNETAALQWRELCDSIEARVTAAPLGQPSPPFPRVAKLQPYHLRFIESLRQHPRAMFRPVLSTGWREAVAHAIASDTSGAEWLIIAPAVIADSTWAKLLGAVKGVTIVSQHKYRNAPANYIARYDVGDPAPKTRNVVFDLMPAGGQATERGLAWAIAHARGSIWVRLHPDALPLHGFHTIRLEP